MNDLQEQHLVDALEREAEQYEPSPDALTTILARTDQTPRLRLVGGGRHHVRTGVIAGVVSAALVAAVTVFAVTGGMNRDSAPRPVDRPTMTPSGAPAFDPPPPDSTFTLFRVTDVKGEPELTTEMARATPPFDPSQALRTLFSTPTLSADSTGPRTGGVQETSITLSDDAIDVDLAATDAPLPEGATAEERAATARTWLQAVVRTIQSAYGSDLPVRIRLDGRPTTLYGVSTRELIVDLNLPSTEAREIYLPTAGERVTSPVTFWASPPEGQWRWQVYDARTGAKVDDGESAYFPGEGSFGAGLDLAPGDYRAVLGGQGGRTLGQVSFTVTDGVIGTVAMQRKVESSPFAGLSTEPDQDAPNASPVTFAGSVGRERSLTYYLQDAVGGVTLRQGLVVAGEDGSYAFQLDLEPGRYRLRLERSGPGEYGDYTSTQDLTVR